MNYWIFKCNPEKYNIYGRLNNPEKIITWQVTRYKDEISPGDIAFIWPTGKNRGICAIVKIETQPKDIPELEHEIPYYFDLNPGIACRVIGTIISIFECIPYRFLQSVPALQNMSVFHGFQQSTNFRLNQEEGRNIMEIIKIRS